MTQLAASPEELARFLGEPLERVDEVAEAFVKTVRASLPRWESSFCGFCSNYRGWTPSSEQPPHFFGMLWFTCLIAYGYPGTAGDFGGRLRAVLGKAENFQHGAARLEDFWIDLARWTRMRRDAGAAIRELRLPPRDEKRTVIGYSHFLAFPNKFDRRVLARALDEADLVGFEPPLQPVLDAIEKEKRSFSRDFREDLAEFRGFLRRGGDPQKSAFWRAVRTEALDPSTETRDSARGGDLVVIANEDGLVPVVAVRRRPASPWQLRDFDNADPWIGYLTAADGDLEEVWQRVFRGNFDRLARGHRALVQQGVLVLRERTTGLYEVESGADVHGCEMALVRKDLVDSFRRAFGGKSARAIVPGWFEIAGAAIRQVERLPEGLEKVVQLLPTMAPPSISLADGVQVGRGFLALQGVLPIVRAPGAVDVSLRRAHETAGVSLQPTNDAWTLPDGLVPGEYVLEAAWPYGETRRLSSRHVAFVGQVAGDDFKSLPSGSFSVEACVEPESAVASKDVPLGVASATPSGDFLDLERSARYIGPGFGEMSISAQAGYDWLVVGPKKHPELLVFIGDPLNPTPPAMRRSPRKGDRLHWRAAFKAKHVLWRDDSGTYRPLDEAPSNVRAAFEILRRHDVPADAPTCRETALETALPESSPCEPHRRLRDTLDVIAGLAVRRSGLTYHDVRAVFVATTNERDPIVFQQVLRAWNEAGLVDVVRREGVSRLVVAARRPRFVLVRRGPHVDATLVGLVTSARGQAVTAEIERAGLRAACTLVGSASPWQSRAVRVRASIADVAALTARAALEPFEWLSWNDPRSVPDELDVSRALERIYKSPPPPSFQADAVWEWETSEFRRRPVTDRDVVCVERRRHRDESTIYVVSTSGLPTVWSHNRTWTLLAAHGYLGVPPFRCDADGRLSVRGRNPIHLPLPLARLCALIGDGLPGPRKSSVDELEYSYPFGARLFAAARRVIPRHWIQSLT